jgi:hypothetical protein
MTPKEAAKEVDRVGSNPSTEVDDFLVKASARELQEFINLHSAMLYSHWLERAKVAVSIRLAEEQSKSADKLIKHTEKLTQQTDKMIEESINISKLTKVLIWLTVAIGVFAIVQILIMVFDYLKHK